MKKALIGVVALLTLSLVGCGNTNNDSLSKEDQFKQAIEKSVKDRWEYGDKNESTYVGTDKEIDYLKKNIQIEKDILGKFENTKLNDEKLNKLKNDYMNGLKEQEDSLKYYEFDSQKLTDKWTQGYIDRNLALYDLVNDYKLDVDKDKFKDISDKVKVMKEQQEENRLIENMVKNVKFKKSEEGGGWSTYIAKVKNPTNKTFNQFVLDINLEDKDGNPIEKTNVLMENWKPNQEKTVQFMTDKPFDKMEYEYSIID